MLALERMPMPWWLRVASTLRLARILRRLRYDTRHLPAVERPSDDDGLRMLALITLAKQHDFDLQRLPRTRAVLIEDLAFNAMLIAANRALEHDRGRARPATCPSQLVERFRSTERALDALWDEAAGQYFSRDAVTGELIRVPTIATFLPLWSGTLPGGACHAS